MVIEMLIAYYILLNFYITYVIDLFKSEKMYNELIGIQF